VKASIMPRDLAHERGEARDLGPAFIWAVLLNVGYVLIEAGVGFTIGSLALLADAAHNLTDVAGLLIAWGAHVAARRPPSERFSYGFGRTTILAALANAIAILIGVGAVVLESVQRFSDPLTVPAAPILVVAAVGIAINAGTAMLFRRDRRHDLNAEGAFLHMAADAVVSAGVVVSAAAMLVTGWTWLDPLAAILVSAVVAWAAFGLLRSSIGLALDAVPPLVDRAAVAAWLTARPGVSAIHDLHIWALSTTTTAITAHLTMPGGHPGDAFLGQLADELNERFGIGHTTLQVEIGDGTECRLTRGNVV
jgi:cobalt-zinc-cadmium efflux system protein